MAFLDQLNKICEEKGVSLTKIAEDTGLTATAAFGWKRGAVPRKSTLRAIADKYGVTVDWLMSNDPMPTVWDSTQESSAYMPLSAAEKQIIDMYRAVDEMGRMRMAQAILAVYDKEMSK